VVTCHDLIPACFPQEYLAGPGRAPEARAYRRFLGRLAKARLVLTPSSETAGDVVALAGVPEERVRVVPWGVPSAPGGAEPTAGPPGPAVPGGPYVLYASSIEPHKNAGLAVEAIARAEAGIRLLMAGSWSSRREHRLRRLAAEAGAADRVEWLGLLTPEQLAPLRAGAAGIVVPSRKEGFGFPLLEGLAAGVPVLASDTPALREVGGDAATYLPADDPGAWATAISALAGADTAARAAAAERGRARAAGFTWERTARLMMDAYREAAG
jgi:glycosyltransferase involved in cell wall biosynthesis